jgi:hypothetical protein
MNAISDFRTWVSTQPKLPPAPKRVMPSAVSLDDTLAAMKADADRWKRRKVEVWGEGMSVGDNPTAHRRIRFWTLASEAEFQANILAALKRNGPMTVPEILDRLAKPKNRHKLRDMLTELRKAGKVTVTQGKRHEWSCT